MVAGLTLAGFAVLIAALRKRYPVLVTSIIRLILALVVIVLIMGVVYLATHEL